MEFIHLVGAEDIPRAAGAMREAAHTMLNVSGNMQYVLEAHQRGANPKLIEFVHTITAPQPKKG